MTYLKKIITKKYTKFFFIGATGVLINLIVTGLLQLILKPQNFYIASIIGTATNLIYNFYMHTKITFKTKNKHKQRLAIFTIYTLTISAIQETIIKNITPLIGINYLIIIKATIILTFSIITYILYNNIIFNEKQKNK
ncbi:MAG: GtrA family protein [Candidatus Woesearchaeota archaeon]